MAFEIRCLKCNAKLRFDDAPTAGEEIECPKCTRTFIMPKSAEPKKEEPKKAAKKPRPLTIQERVHFSPLLLTLIVGTLVGMLFGGMFAIWIWLYLAGKSVDMLATVPDNFNVISGVNVRAMRNYSKLKQEQDKYYDATAQGIFTDVAKKLDLNPDTSLRYFVVAREAGGTTPTLMLFLTEKKFDRGRLGGGSPQPLGRGMSVSCPTDTLIAVAFNGKEGATLTAVGEYAKKRPKDGMHEKVGTAGMMAIRGHVWHIIRPTGALSKYFAESATAIKEDGSMKSISDAFGSAKLFSSWTSFGGQGCRFGAAINVSDSDAARSLAKDMRAGPLGKGDESEPPNATKQVFSFLTQQKEFLQYLEYKSTGNCAYLISKMESPDKARAALDVFNKAGRGLSGGGFQQ
jgi:DNA-directed RNA polymerase subunit RPC12/RpoP